MIASSTTPAAAPAPPPDRRLTHRSRLFPRAGLAAAAALMLLFSSAPGLASGTPGNAAPLLGDDAWFPSGPWQLLPFEPGPPTAPARGAGRPYALLEDAVAPGPGVGSPTDLLEPEGKGRRPNHLLGALIAAGAVVGSAANSFFDAPRRPFHLGNEGWFGQDTYAGGADKASHFVDYYILSKEMAFLYEKLGYSPAEARWLGFGVAAVTGLVTEFGDGVTTYGFSYEDLLMDLMGAGLAGVVAALGAQDLIGFRHGFLLPTSTNTCCQVPGRGHDYSYEIFTADLKLVGMGRRLDWNIGPLRWLLFSVTYGSKGYPTGLPEDRERQVGFQVGLNLEQILNDVGVQRNTWWGYLLHVVFDNVQFPYTAVGYYYDLNHGKWSGPGIGNSYGVGMTVTTR
jgi:hypothetical protein